VSNGLEESARNEAALSRNYIVLTVASCVIATLGLIENSVAIIIGAMIIAPLIGPIQAFAYAALSGDLGLVRRALTTAISGVAIAVLTSWALGAAIAVPAAGSEVLARTRPTVLDLVIALAAGAIAGFAKVRPAVGSAIAGTAIAVALMPPLCVVGLAIAGREWSWAKGAALLFGTNFLGIALACMVVYLLARRLRTHNRPALVMTIGLATALAFPLGAGFLEIVRKGRLEAEIRHELVVNTVTFRNVRLAGARFDWYANPISAVLDVSAGNAVTPAQVRDLEAFIARRTKQDVRLVMQVRRYETVTDRGAGAQLPESPSATGR